MRACGNRSCVNPECDEADLRATLQAVADLKPITVFHEPINVRAENVARMQAEDARVGLSVRTDVFATRESWQGYAIESLRTAERVAREIGIGERLHLWPDKSLGSQTALRQIERRSGQSAESFQGWLQHYWGRISEWPRAHSIAKGNSVGAC